MPVSEAEARAFVGRLVKAGFSITKIVNRDGVNMGNHFGFSDKDFGTGGGSYLRIKDGDEAEVIFLPGATRREYVFSGGRYEDFDPTRHAPEEKKISFIFNVKDLSDDAEKTFECNPVTARAIRDLTSKLSDLSLAVFRIQRTGNGPATRYPIKQIKRAVPGAAAPSAPQQSDNGDDRPF